MRIGRRNSPRALLLIVLACTSALCACRSPGSLRAGATGTGSASGAATSGVPSAGSAKTSSRKLATNPFDVPSSDRRIVYSDGLISDPVPANTSVRPQISADQALDIANRNIVSREKQPGDPTATLRLVSVGYLGQDASAVPHLAWVLTWLGGKASPRGPISDDERKRLVASLRCVFVSVIDATTGDIQDDRQICRAG